VQVANKIGVTLHPSDISIFHRMAPSTPIHPNPNIIVKFLSCKVRDNIYSKRIKLKLANASFQPGHLKVFINESLTKQNRESFKKCNDFKKNIWTKNRLTYLRKDDASQTIIIQNNKDLHKFGIAAQI